MRNGLVLWIPTPKSVHSAGRTKQWHILTLQMSLRSFPLLQWRVTHIGKAIDANITACLKRYCMFGQRLNFFQLEILYIYIPWKSTTILKMLFPFGWFWNPYYEKGWFVNEAKYKMVVGLPGHHWRTNSACNMCSVFNGNRECPPWQMIAVYEEPRTTSWKNQLLEVDAWYGRQISYCSIPWYGWYSDE